MNKDQELELLEGFRRLSPATRNTVLTAVSMAAAAEDAVRRELAEKGQLNKENALTAKN